MQRTQTHARETVSRDMVKSKIDAFYGNGDALIREWSERDYGIDCVMELFDNGIPTGKIVFLQIKGTEKTISKLKTANEVSCPKVSESCLKYAQQDRIPLVLIYASTNTPNCFYYQSLQEFVRRSETSLHRKYVSVRIPVENYAENDLSGYFHYIKKLYE